MQQQQQQNIVVENARKYNRRTVMPSHFYRAIADILHIIYGPIWMQNKKIYARLHGGLDSLIALISHDIRMSIHSILPWIMINGTKTSASSRTPKKRHNKKME